LSSCCLYVFTECTLFRKFESKKEFAVNAKIIHIDVDAATISRNIDVDIPIVANVMPIVPPGNSLNDMILEREKSSSEEVLR